MEKNLIGSKRFLPFFITQFLGAFNDNIFKNTLILMLTYKLANGSAFLVNLSAVLFILPFFLFSSIGGQLGDKFEKAALIKYIKLFEIVIMSIGSLFFILNLVYPLMGVLFLMGTQSALFGPVKYSILPQQLKHNELVKANALVESGTFIAILFGTIYAGFAVQYDDISKYIIAGSVLVISILGYISSCFIPKTQATNSELKIKYNIMKETYLLTKKLKNSKKSVRNSVLAISWFWFIGTIFITQFPIYTKDFLFGDESVVILMLTVFSLSIGIGSILTEKLTSSDVEIGLVPIGAFGITIGGLMLYSFTSIIPDTSDHTLRTAIEFIALPHSWSIIASVFVIGLSGGLYTVPLYTLLQLRTQSKERSQIIAINNVINSLFMVIAGIYSIVVLTYHFNVVELLLSVAVLNVFVSIYIFIVVPEFTFRFLAFIILKGMYRIRKKNINIPTDGGLVIVGNHISYMDALILSAVIPRPMRFVMYYKIFNIPIMRFIFKQLKAIPIAGIREDRTVFDNAFNEIAKALENDEVVFIFPEGCLTRDGEINKFKSGIEHIIKRTPVPVYTLALQGLWGSFFSKKKGSRPFKRIYSKVNVVGGSLVQPNDVTKENLEQIVRTLRGDKR